MITPRNPIDRRARRLARGFTLIEAIVVIVIIGVLATLIAPRLIGRVGSAKIATTRANAAAVASALRLYHSDMGGFPDSGNILALAARPNSPEEKGPWIENPDQLKDAWGNSFHLVVPGQKNMDFDVVSYGADNKPGGSGDDADIIVP